MDRALSITKECYLAEDQFSSKLSLPELVKGDLHEVHGNDVTEDVIIDKVRSMTKLPNLWTKTWTARFARPVIMTKDTVRHSVLKSVVVQVENDSKMAAGNVGQFGRNHEKPRDVVSTKADTGSEATDHQELEALASFGNMQGNLQRSNSITIGLKTNIRRQSKRPPDDVKDAIRMAKIVKYKILKDRLAGIDNTKRPPKEENGLSDQKERSSTENLNSGNATNVGAFTKSSDFNQKQDFVENYGFLYQWKIDITVVDSGIHTENSNLVQKAKGRLHRNLKPCTKAMLKYGTSPSQTKARVLKEGEIDVTKVWRRPTALFDTPLAMARQDTTVTVL